MKKFYIRRASLRWYPKATAKCEMQGSSRLEKYSNVEGFFKSL